MNTAFIVPPIAINVMPVHLFIQWFSMLIWFLPPFRQYNQKYFGYFLVLALTDPVALFLNLVFHIHPLKPFIVLSFLLLLTLFDLNKPVTRLISGIAFLLMTAASFYLTTPIANVLMIFCHLMILSVIIKHLARFIGKEQSISLFLIALVFYETTIILKMYVDLIKEANFTLNYFITTGFEIFLALIFILFRSDDKRLHLRIVSNPEKSL